MKAHHTEHRLVHAGVGLLGVVAIFMGMSLASCEQGGSTRSTQTGPRPVVGAAPPAPALAPSPASSSTQPLTATQQGVSAAAASAASVAITHEPEMRVRVLAAARGVDLSSPAGIRVKLGEAPAGVAGTAPIPGAVAGVYGESGSRIRVTIEEGSFVLRESGASGSLARPVSSSRPAVSDVAAFDGWELARFPVAGGVMFEPNAMTPGAINATNALRVDGKVWPGRVRLLARSDTSDRAFDVIEHVKIEDYLPGVVGKEMFRQWPQAAFEAQAVCARTYALHERSRSLSLGETFDVEASEADQAYDAASVTPRAIEAVRNTRGQVVMHRNQILRCYYSSTCGGRAGAARDTWPTYKGFEYNLAAPIQEHDRNHYCSASPRYRWTVTRDRGELVRRLRTFGERNRLMVRQIRGLHSIVPMQENGVGRPNRYRIVEPGGRWFQLSGEELRLACNTPVEGLAPIDSTTRVFSSDLSVSVRGDEVTITGRGFGHGVGMCQYCVKAMADAGRQWRDIVTEFYPGAEVRKLY